MAEKTLEQRVADLEQAIAETPKRGKWLAAAERDLREAALQYARTKAGFILESDGSRILVHRDDAESYANMFQRRMEAAAEGMLRELSIEEKSWTE